MRTLVKTTLVTMLVVFSVLILFWSLARNSNAAQSAQAAPATPTIPEHCVKDLQERLAKKPGMKEQQAAIQAEAQCAADAQTYPSRKQTALAQITPFALMPTTTLGPTATLQVGIQKGIYVRYSADIFVPTRNSNNLWADIVNGKAVEVYAGSLRDDNWQDHPNLPRQGVLKVAIDYLWSGKMYPTPSRHGDIHFIAACGTKLFLQAADGTIFAFDAATLSYVSNNVMACPTVTPRAGIVSSEPLIDSGNFALAEDYHDNTWRGMIHGKLVQMYAGSMYEEDNPNNPNRPLQGSVLVRVAGAKDAVYPTPKRSGEVHFIAACGTKLFLQATDGTVFVFDAATLAYVDNAPACPTVTPKE